MRKAFGAFALAGALVFAGTSSASAQFVTGVYLGAYGGANFASDGDVMFEDAPGVSGRVEFDNGYVLGGVVGYSPRVMGLVPLLDLRTELDINYRRNNVDAFHADLAGIGTGRTTDVFGHVDSWSGFANVWLDLDLGAWTPYAGAGLGASRISINDLRIRGERAADDRDTVFAYQLGAGAAFQFTPATALTLDYRYFVADDPSFTDADGSGFDMEYRNHSLMAGIRFGF